MNRPAPASGRSAVVLRARPPNPRLFRRIRGTAAAPRTRRRAWRPDRTEVPAGRPASSIVRPAAVGRSLPVVPDREPDAGDQRQTHIGLHVVAVERFDFHVLDEFRDECGFPLQVTSGYRAPTHPIEAAKKAPGWHSKGRAVDFYIPDGVRMRRALELAVRAGFPGIGVGNHLLHLDIRDTTPVVWGY